MAVLVLLVQIKGAAFVNELVPVAGFPSVESIFYCFNHNNNNNKVFHWNE